MSTMEPRPLPPELDGEDPRHELEPRWSPEDRAGLERRKRGPGLAPVRPEAEAPAEKQRG